MTESQSTDESGSDNASEGNFDWNWSPMPTPLDPWGPLRAGLYKSLQKLNPKNGALLVKVSILAVTHMMVLAERLLQIHKLGHNAVPNRNLKEPIEKVNKKKLEIDWPIMKSAVNRLKKSTDLLKK